MSTSEQRHQYWRRNLLVVFSLLLVWFVVTFGVAFYARELGSVDFFGWPFSYWVGAQGALIVYVIIIFAYARYMNRLDQHYRPTNEFASQSDQARSPANSQEKEGDK